jgi:hypothetical protein
MQSFDVKLFKIELESAQKIMNFFKMEQAKSTTAMFNMREIAQREHNSNVYVPQMQLIAVLYERN